MSFSEQILFRFVDHFLKSTDDLKLHGPLFLSNEKDKALIIESIRFRTEQNLLRAPWLETPHQLALEDRLQLDLRSAHFVVTRDDRIVVCLRLTPGPFELSSLAEMLKEREDSHAGFWEYSRLCTHVDLPNKGKVARLLLIKAGLWLFSQTEAKGIIAVCKEDKLNYMAKFALYKEGESFEIDQRYGKYSFISAPRDSIIIRFMKEFLNIKSTKNDSHSRHVS